ncbi:MAG: DUF2971 domain-containing protein [Christensenellales bacterium]|jgi:hypothetical protein
MIDDYFEALAIPPIAPKEYGTVYHYTSPDGLLGILDEEGIKLWFSKYDCLNDASEGQDITEYYRSACKSLYENHEISDKLYQQIKGLEPDDTTLFGFPIPDGNDKKGPFAILEKVKYDTYICCFSANNNLLPMWNYYVKGNAYQGYNIGLKTEMFENTRRNRNIGFYERNGFLYLNIGKVIYDSDEKLNVLRQRILLFSDRFRQTSDPKNLKNNIISMLNTLRIIFKNQAFKHEEEIRAILYRPIEIPPIVYNELLKSEFQKKGFPQNELTTYKLPKIHYRTQAGIVVPYVIVQFYRYSDYLRSITIGPMENSGAAIHSLNTLLDDRRHRAEIKLSEIPVRY